PPVSHHSAARRANRSISAGSRVGAACGSAEGILPINASSNGSAGQAASLLRSRNLLVMSTPLQAALDPGAVDGCPKVAASGWMSYVVMKFGGTSVANLERIRNVARHVKREVDARNKVAVVVSAMAGVTNQLVAWVREASPLHDAREYDSVVATGEQVTAGLLAIGLQSMGVPARSWQGWQSPRFTDNAHSGAPVQDLPSGKIRARLEQGEVAVITGFQGIEPGRNRVSTLGRGGSDTSAVALAVAVRADLCDIYTDVDGVYTTDPRIVPRAQRLSKVSYEEMLEMASLGSKALQTRSVELAMVQRMRVAVVSRF